jgi:hypothetical protein
VTELIRACSCGGGGAFDYARHQPLQRDRGGEPGAPVARTVPAPVGRRVDPLSPRSGSGRGADGLCCGGVSANQASQQKLNAALTRAWWRRITMSERAWKPARPSWSLTCL